MRSNTILRIKRALYSSELYSTCGDLPLFLFIKIYETDDYKYLIKSGYPTDGEIKQAWQKIYTEYLALSKDKAQDYLYSCMKDVSFYGNKLYLIETIVNQLMISRSQILIDQLHLMGFRFQYDIFGSERYLFELRNTVTQSKQLIFRLKERQKDLEALKQQDTGSDKGNEYDFLLTELSKFQGYRIDPHTTSVAEFCAIVNRFKLANPTK